VGGGLKRWGRSNWLAGLGRRLGIEILRHVRSRKKAASPFVKNAASPRIFAFQVMKPSRLWYTPARELTQ
jgi:hypothetical protein